MRTVLFSFRKWQTKANHFRSTYTLCKCILRFIVMLVEGYIPVVIGSKAIMSEWKKIIAIISKIAIYVCRYIADEQKSLPLPPLNVVLVNILFNVNLIKYQCFKVVTGRWIEWPLNIIILPCFGPLFWSIITTISCYLRQNCNKLYIKKTKIVIKY